MKKTIILFAVFFISLNASAEEDNSIELMDKFYICVKSNVIELDKKNSPAPEILIGDLFDCMKPFHDLHNEEGDDIEDNDVQQIKRI